MIIEVNKLTKARVSKDFVKSILNEILNVMGAGRVKSAGPLSVALVDKKTIRVINKKYRRVNEVTDVLAFDDPAEIVICWPQLAAQAAHFGHSRKRELMILLIHGFLHILGYDHRTKEEESLMEREADKIIKAMTSRAK